MCYRTKYDPPLLYRDHDRFGPVQDDDIDDYPDILDGSFTILMAVICDRFDFDAVDRFDRAKILDLINGTYTYYDGYFSNQNDLMEEVLLNRNKGAIGAIGVRFNSQLNENDAFYKRILNAAFGGEYYLSKIYSSAKLYSYRCFEQNRSRRTPGNLQMGDVMLFGDPSMIVNTPNCDAPVSTPSNLNLTSNSGKLVIQWSPVSNTSGYAISISDVPEMMPWTIFSDQTQLSISEFEGVKLEHNTKYYVNVKAYHNTNGIRSFARNAGCNGDIVLDKFVNPPSNVLSEGNSNNSINVTFSPSPDSGVISYNVYRSPPNSRSSPELLSSNASTSFSDNTCNSGDYYVYYVSAVDNKNNESEKVITSPVSITDYVKKILGFEDSNLWSFIHGSSGLLINNPQYYTEGEKSIGIEGNGFQYISTSDMNTNIIDEKAKLQVDIYLGSNQPNPYWIGQLQLIVNCPSGYIYNVFIGAVELTNLTIGAFNTVQFTLPANVLTVLAGDYDDFSIQLALNTNAGSGPYFLDRMIFTD